MKRLPVIAFGVLVAATVAAFFITQHLKVSTPLLNGFPKPVPAVINPIDGVVCGGVNHRQMRVSFYLQNRSDDVDVYIVDQGGTIVRTLASGVHMQGGAHPLRKLFVWNGREDSGRVAPDGIYYVRVALIHQGRTVSISGASGPYPVTVTTTPPAPVVKSVIPHLIPNGSSLSTTITYAGNETPRRDGADLQDGRPPVVEAPAGEELPDPVEGTARGMGRQGPPAAGRRGHLPGRARRDRLGLQHGSLSRPAAHRPRARRPGRE